SWTALTTWRNAVTGRHPRSTGAGTPRLSAARGRGLSAGGEEDRAGVLVDAIVGQEDHQRFQRREERDTHDDADDPAGKIGEQDDSDRDEIAEYRGQLRRVEVHPTDRAGANPPAGQDQQPEPDAHRERHARPSDVVGSEPEEPDHRRGGQEVVRGGVEAAAEGGGPAAAAGDDP